MQVKKYLPLCCFLFCIFVTLNFQVIYYWQLIQAVTKEPRSISKEPQASLVSVKLSVHDSTTRRDFAKMGVFESESHCWCKTNPSFHRKNIIPAVKHGGGSAMAWRKYFFTAWRNDDCLVMWWTCNLFRVYPASVPMGAVALRWLSSDWRPELHLTLIIRESG